MNTASSPSTVAVFTPFVGLAPFYAANRDRIASFQLLNDRGSAVMVLDFENGKVVRDMASACVPAADAENFRKWAAERDACMPVIDYSARTHDWGTVRSGVFAAA